MSFIRRFRPTPPPSRRSSDPAPADTSAVNRSTPPPKPMQNIRNLVETMLSANPAEQEASAEATAALKQIALQSGFYVVASEIRLITESIAARKDHPMYPRAAAGYAFAADLMLRHVLKEIESIRENPGALGPNVFGNYCKDMLENMLRANELNHAVESVVLIAERLMSQSVEFVPLRYAYLDLAGSALQNSRDLIVNSWEQSLNLRRRTPRERHGADSPEREHERRVQAQQERAVQYLDKLAAGFTTVRHAMTVEAKTAVKGTEVDQLLELLTPLDSAGFLGFAAWVTQRVGALLFNTDPKRSRVVLTNSARMYEAAADSECLAGLLRLGASRYSSALALYTKLGMDDAAATVRGKLKPRDAR